MVQTAPESIEKLDKSLRLLRNMAAALLLVNVLTIGACVWFTLSQQDSLSGLRTSWNNFITDYIDQEDMLRQLFRSAGYGGFIHNFKNAVLFTP